MKKLGKILVTILELLIIAYVIVITTCLLCKNKYGYTQFGDTTLIVVNQDNSVELSDFEEGDLLVFDNVRYASLKEGDVIYYYDTLNEQYIIQHGAIESKDGDNRSSVYVLDNESTVSSERVIGVYSKQYKTVGKILSILESRVGFLLIVILPILLLFIYQVYKMIVLLKFDTSDMTEEDVEEKKENKK